MDLLHRLYTVSHFYVNFLPVIKLKEKVRVGSKVKKTCDGPLTPCARVLACLYVSEEQKAQLREIYDLLNPADLRQQINELQDQLLDSVPVL